MPKNLKYILAKSENFINDKHESEFKKRTRSTQNKNSCNRQQHKFHGVA